MFLRRLGKALKYGLVGGVTLSGVGGAVWYHGMATPRQKALLAEIGSATPTILRAETATRFMRTLGVGIVVSVDYKWSLSGLEEEENPEEYAEILSQVHTRTARRILALCLENGGLYIKFGQGLVTMNHVLPKEFLDTLRVLQDRCLTRRSETEVQEIFQEDFGRTPEQMFERFDPEPIAAASLAQVFKARTLDGREVAVKVQYSELRNRFGIDVPTMEVILNLIEVMHPKFSFAWVFKDLKGNFARELDFLAEADNAEQCARDLRHLNFAYVPLVIRDLCHHRVLTTEFIDGIKISDLESLKNANLDVGDIDRKLLRIFAEQIFHSGFVHADPHPGNLLIRKLKDGSPEIVILDHGLYETLPDKTRKPLCKVWQAVVENDYEGMEKNSKLLGVDDYRLFCMALTQRYIAPTEEEKKTDILSQFMDKKGPKNFSRKMFNALPEEEKEKLRVAIGDFHDRMFDMFQNVPSHLVLIFRNLNTIRAVIKDHKTGVDRYQIMARTATQGAFVHEHAGVVDRFKGNWFKLLFDLRLMVDSSKQFFLKLAMRVFFYLGYGIPDLSQDKDSETSTKKGAFESN